MCSTTDKCSTSDYANGCFYGSVPQQNQFCDDDDPFVDINDTDEDMPVLVPVPRDDEDAASAVRTHVPPPDDGGGRATHTTDYAVEIPSGLKPPQDCLMTVSSYVNYASEDDECEALLERFPDDECDSIENEHDELLERFPDHFFEQMLDRFPSQFFDLCVSLHNWRMKRYSLRIEDLMRKAMPEEIGEYFNEDESVSDDDVFSDVEGDETDTD